MTNSLKAQNNCKFERSCGGITFNLYFKHGFHEVCEFKMFLFLTRKRDLVQMQIGEDYGPPPWTTIFKFIGCSLCFLKLSWWFILYHLYLKISYRIQILNEFMTGYKIIHIIPRVADRSVQVELCSLPPLCCCPAVCPFSLSRQSYMR